MANRSPIEWTDATWNPITGCTKISPGCKFCYAERMAKRLNAMGQENYRNGFRLTLQPQMLEIPLHWRQPRRIFVNSMSDLIHEDVPLAYIEQVFDVMNSGFVAPISSSDETFGAPSRDQHGSEMATADLDGRQY